MLSSSEQRNRLEQFNKEIGALESLDRALLEEAHGARDKDRDTWIAKIDEQVMDTWQARKPLAASARSGATLSVTDDGTVLASGKNPPKEIYEARLSIEGTNLIGLRLEALPDSSLPEGKSGRGAKGEFVLTSVSVLARAAGDLPSAPKPSRQDAWSILGPFSAGSLKEALEKKWGPEDGLDLAKTYQDGKLKWRELKDHPSDEFTFEGTNAATFVTRKIHFDSPVRAFVSLEDQLGAQLWVNGRRLHATEGDQAGQKSTVKIPAYFKSGENTLLVKVVHHAGPGLKTALLTEPVKEYAVDLAAATADFNGGGYSAGGVLDDRNTTGWSLGEDDAAKKPRSLYLRAHDPFGFAERGELVVTLKFESPKPAQTLGRFKLSTTSSALLGDFFDLPENARGIFAVSKSERNPDQRLELQRHYRRTFVPEIKEWVKTLGEKRKQRDDHRNSIDVSMVMEDMSKRRDSFLLVRGEFGNRGAKVEPGVLTNVFPLPEGLPPNRLGLAKWLVHPEHPLTSRVTVNRYWQQYFGTGLVKTAEEFGSQGERPSHPELLDWLAVEFVKRGWDMKAMHKMIVMSATYRQDSEVEAALLKRDPESRLLARFPRSRLEAETIRDNALAISGLLKPRVGGKSVYPYQPPGMWEAMAFEGTRSWVQSQGDENYRRGIYTYWRRSVPYPSYVIFDAPTRETCTVRRPRTNTPLQALTLMNDPVYVEASRALGHRIMTQGGKTLREQIEFAFKTALGRPPSAKERRILENAYKRELKQFEKDRVSAAKLVHVGASKPPLEADICELAAWTIVGNLLLNLDETVTKG